MTIFPRLQSVATWAMSVWLLTCLIICLGSTSMQAEEEKPPKPVTIGKVESAELVVKDKTLQVTAVGEVPTGGYTKPMLTRLQYFKQPDDGIQDYTFEATPPAGVAAQVISRVTASDKWPALPDWVKGVRIHGVGDGVLVKMLERK
ncbi:MAG: hypothetical protein WD872_10345 [Pirellulaceae bacterium]